MASDQEGECYWNSRSPGAVWYGSVREPRVLETGDSNPQEGLRIRQGKYPFSEKKKALKRNAAQRCSAKQGGTSKENVGFESVSVITVIWKCGEVEQCLNQRESQRHVGYLICLKSMGRLPSVASTKSMSLRTPGVETLSWLCTVQRSSWLLFVCNKRLFCSF